jgi:hypothetical protein
MNVAHTRDLPLGGCTVIQCSIDWGFTLRLAREADTFEIRVEQPFTFTTSAGEILTVQPEEDPTTLGPVLTITRTSVVASHISSSGNLELCFADDSSMDVPPSADFEAWSLTGPHGLRIVCGPNGEITKWTPHQDTGETGAHGTRAMSR